jgi:hypothetical protein
VEHFIELSKALGPWALSVVGGVIAKLLHTGIKELRKLKETEVKADLAYKEVSERVPSIKSSYETWAAHR